MVERRKKLRGKEDRINKNEIKIRKRIKKKWKAKETKKKSKKKLLDKKSKIKRQRKIGRWKLQKNEKGEEGKPKVWKCERK